MLNTVSEKDLLPYFVDSGFEGLIDNKIYQAGYSDVAGIISRGGTKIHSSRSARFMEIKYRKQALENLKSHDISSFGGFGWRWFI